MHIAAPQKIQFLVVVPFGSKDERSVSTGNQHELVVNLQSSGADADISSPGSKKSPVFENVLQHHVFSFLLWNSNVIWGITDSFKVMGHRIQLRVVDLDKIVDCGGQ